MAILTVGVEAPVRQGDYLFKVTVSSGTTTLEWDVENTGFIAIEGAVYTADAAPIITFGEKCKVRFTETGSSTVVMTNVIKHSG